MSFLSFVEKIEAKLQEVQENLKSHSDRFSELSSVIEKQASEKLITSNNLHILNGALQAYTDVLSLFKNSDCKSETIEGTVVSDTENHG